MCVEPDFAADQLGNQWSERECHCFSKLRLLEMSLFVHLLVRSHFALYVNIMLQAMLAASVAATLSKAKQGGLSCSELM